MYSPSTLAIHHIFRCHGFSSFSCSRRRMVSRDTVACSVNSIIRPANSFSVQRAQPSGALEQAVASNNASSFPESFRISNSA